MDLERDSDVLNASVCVVGRDGKGGLGGLTPFTRKNIIAGLTVDYSMARRHR